MTTRRGFALSLCAGAMLLAFAGKAEAKAKELVIVEVRVIKGAVHGAPFMDPALLPLKKDLQSGLPFRRFELLENHHTMMKAGEQVSIQFPGPKKSDKRFLVVKARGPQKGGMIGFELTIKALKFKTRVAVKDGGTLVVGGPNTDGGKILFAITAREAHRR